MYKAFVKPKRDDDDDHDERALASDSAGTVYATQYGFGVRMVLGKVIRRLFQMTRGTKWFATTLGWCGLNSEFDSNASFALPGTKFLVPASQILAEARQFV